MPEDVVVTEQGTLASRLDADTDLITSQQLVILGAQLLKETQRTLQEVAPAGTNTGALYKSLGVSKVYKNIDGDQSIRVGSPLVYAPVIEKGRQPGKKQPPVEFIKIWLVQKAIPIPQGLTLNQYAFLIARKIGKRGTAPKAARNFGRGIL
jgi:hypothetical protein